jgi:hypothetical protein
MLFFGSRRFHGTYGFFGEAADYHMCRRGFEWYDFDIPGPTLY